MSRSKRFPVYKDKGICSHQMYRRKIRHRIRQSVKEILSLSDIETYELPSPKTLVNDWDWCDYTLWPDLWKDSAYKDDYIAKLSRK